MSSQIIVETTRHLPLFFTILGIATGAKALASVLQTWIEQAARTHRLGKALEDSSPSQRPGIITACSQLEGRSAEKSEPNYDALPEHAHLRSALMLQSKSNHKRHGKQ